MTFNSRMTALSSDNVVISTGESIASNPNKFGAHINSQGAGLHRGRNIAKFSNPCRKI